MTEDNTATATPKPIVKNKRVKYGFDLQFPPTFTLRDLRNAKHHKVKYITLYARVQKALENGTVVEAGLKDPTKARRGRKEVIYKVVKASSEPIQTAEVAIPSVGNW